ncbi:SRPBCC domain-containing protein [Rhodobacterales bacterium HKCCE2091]|nr:SRPBCC domain-containing protein [Rhodobacterales bacterium HKCCE2091]
MPDLELTRSIPAPPTEVWDAIARPEILLTWWGHDGFTLHDTADLDLGREGPWRFGMTSTEGRRMTASGHVTHVRPGRSVGFTWAWHDPEGRRGPESHVTIALAETADGHTELTLRQTGLADADSVARQGGGWGSTLGRLQRLFTA